MERIWLWVSGLCGVGSAISLVFWLRGRWEIDAAFSVAALGAVAWFLSLRERLQAQNLAREAETSDAVESDVEETEDEN